MHTVKITRRTHLGFSHIQKGEDIPDLPQKTGKISQLFPLTKRIKDGILVWYCKYDIHGWVFIHHSEYKRFEYLMLKFEKGKYVENVLNVVVIADKTMLFI